MRNNYFEGYYFKHQKNGQTIALIPGKSMSTAFIQVITSEESRNIDFPNIQIGEKIIVGGCDFSTDGIKINLPNIRGEIQYSGITPIKYDIMGPFKYFPMECSHSVISMHHRLSGSLTIGERVLDFTNGTGYIEKDSGRSFPKQYVWLQCNDFPEKCSIMVSVAHIPFMGFSFTGCICVIVYNSTEYRLATYLGVKIVCVNENHIVLKQGKYLLDIEMQNSNAHQLLAPKDGCMTGLVRESNSTKARFNFFIGKKLLLDFKSDNASLEYHMQ